jgi:hypothetical protein
MRVTKLIVIFPSWTDEGKRKRVGEKRFSAV